MSDQIHAPAVLFPGKDFSVTTERADPNAILQTQLLPLHEIKLQLLSPWRVA
jgi:hypothetical protein